MRDGDIDELLKDAAERLPQVKPALLESVAGAIQPSLRRVRPLPATWVLTGGVFLICATIALAGAARAGFNGFAKMDLLERVLIFSTLSILAWLAATEFVHEMIPGSRRRISAEGMLALGSVAMLAVFAALFRDYHTDHFVSAGLICLAIGVVHAIPAALLSWWILRRGFAVNPQSAGLLAGTIGGLAGVGMLELHCPNFQAMHILIWHTAVLLVSAALGAVLGRVLQRRAQPLRRVAAE